MKTLMIPVWVKIDEDGELYQGDEADLVYDHLCDLVTQIGLDYTWVKVGIMQESI